MRVRNEAERRRRHAAARRRHERYLDRLGREAEEEEERRLAAHQRRREAGERRFSKGDAIDLVDPRGLRLPLAEQLHGVVAGMTAPTGSAGG